MFLFNPSVDEQDMHIYGLKIDGNNSYYDGPSGSPGGNNASWIGQIIYINAPIGLTRDNFNCTIKDCRISNAPNTAMAIHGNGTVVENCIIDNAGTYGADVGDNSVIIKNNYFYRIQYSAVLFCTNMWHCRVTDNHFQENYLDIYGIGSGSNDRIPLYVDEYHIIANNNFQDTEKLSIYFGNYARGINVIGNTFENINTADGDNAIIKCGSGREINVTGNIFIDNQEVATTFRKGVYFNGCFDNIVISNNIFQSWAAHSTTSYMINLASNNAPVIVSNNTFNGSVSYSIFFSECPEGGIISNNTFTNFINSAIYLKYSTQNIQIIGNHLIGNGGSSCGITMASVTEGNVNYIITDNYLENFLYTFCFADCTYYPDYLTIIGNQGGTWDFEGHYPTNYRPDIGGADFKADIEQFNFGTVTAS